MLRKVMFSDNDNEHEYIHDNHDTIQFKHNRSSTTVKTILAMIMIDIVYR